MRITDIILEKSAEYQQGYDAVDKLLSPSRWNEPAGAAPDTKTSKTLDPLDVKDAVSALVNNRKFYEAQRQVLIKLASEIKSGQRNTDQDSQQLAAILNLAASGKPINDQQRAVLAGFLKEL